MRYFILNCHLICYVDYFPTIHARFGTQFPTTTSHDHHSLGQRSVEKRRMPLDIHGPVWEGGLVDQ